MKTATTNTRLRATRHIKNMFPQASRIFLATRGSNKGFCSVSWRIPATDITQQMVNHLYNTLHPAELQITPDRFAIHFTARGIRLEA